MSRLLICNYACCQVGVSLFVQAYNVTYFIVFEVNGYMMKAIYQSIVVRAQ